MKPTQLESFSRPMRAIRILAEAAILLYGLGANAYLVARITTGERWSWVAFANNFVPWWALGALAAAVLALFSTRRWPLIALQVPVIVVFVAVYGPLILPHPSALGAGSDPDGTLRVATYNTLSIDSDPARVVETVAALDADLVGLQELGPYHTDLLIEQLSAEYPYRSLHPQLPVHGVGLLSRYPIREAEVIRLLPDSMLSLRAVVEIEGRPVTVVVTHPSPPRNAFSPLTYDATRRDREIGILLADHLDGIAGPLIVMGDFNMTDQSDTYRAVAAQFEDAFREAGRGMGFTFPATRNPALRIVGGLVRIDYVWHNAHFTALDAWPGPDGGTSDHRPMVAELAWN
jgi:vancomycin resistance protein VanJ